MIRRLVTALAACLLFAAPAFSANAPAKIDLASIANALVGTWQSTDDTKFTREFDAGGRTVDRYEGDDSATTPGHWSLFLGKTPPPALAGQKFDPDSVYLELDQNGDVLLFGMAGLSRSDLKMVYLERGNLMSFTRLK